MAHGDFVWCDLSARRIDNVCTFYNELFGWQYYRDAAPDGAEYRVAYAANPIAGIYRMPKTFDDMGMPCFWMPYIEVASAAAAIDIAYQDHDD